MNFKKAIKRRIKDEWAVTPSSSLIKRLVGNLSESRSIIDRYFPKSQTAGEFISALDEMQDYFEGYK
jgi:hypothetical protein